MWPHRGVTVHVLRSVHSPQRLPLQGRLSGIASIIGTRKPVAVALTESVADFGRGPLALRNCHIALLRPGRAVNLTPHVVHLIPVRAFLVRLRRSHHSAFDCYGEVPCGNAQRAASSSAVRIPRRSIWRAVPPRRKSPDLRSTRRPGDGEIGLADLPRRQIQHHSRRTAGRGPSQLES